VGCELTSGANLAYSSTQLCSTLSGPKNRTGGILEFLVDAKGFDPHVKKAETLVILSIQFRERNFHALASIWDAADKTICL
jgi:hypothetical protein